MCGMVGKLNRRSLCSVYKINAVGGVRTDVVSDSGQSGKVSGYCTTFRQKYEDVWLQKLNCMHFQGTCTTHTRRRKHETKSSTITERS